MICVDSSVAAKWFFMEEHSEQADGLLQAALSAREPIVAPPLLPSEVVNILRQRQRGGTLTLPEAQALLAQFLAVPISLRSPRRVYRRVLELADQYDLPAVYDAHYVALAELLGATFWTADQRLLRAIGTTLPFVRWIGDYSHV
jgi:predicted nucleic acid-binding protein